MGWIPAGDYVVALGGRTVVCRNAAGRRLRSVPSKIAEDPAVTELRRLAEWLGRHERRCLADVERWTVRSLPVPLAVITRVWPDPAWREALRDLVVTDAVGAVTGFLHDADPARGVALAGPDGQRVWIAPTAVLLRHPALLDDLDAWRASAAAQGVEQRTEAGRGAADRAAAPRGRSPALPAEEWKAGFHPLGDERRTVPRVPVAELFTRAWARVRAGDAPRYADLVTRATRR
jgi:hypothetical protein